MFRKIILLSVILGARVMCFAQTSAANLEPKDFQQKLKNTNILIKGSRSMQMEKALSE